MTSVKRSFADMASGQTADSLYKQPTTRWRTETSTPCTLDTIQRVPSCPDARTHKFTADASILMMGVRGSGKTTLAIMAASALSKKIIDMEAVFQRTTGESSLAYSKTHGPERCQEKHHDVLENALRSNSHGSIIVASWMGRHVQKLVRQFATSHPVIHIMRSETAIRECLKLPGEAKLPEFWRSSNAFFRSCCNLEFFNVSERIADSEHQVDGQSTSAPSSFTPLALKQTEQHLLKFLSRIYPPCTIPFFESAYPLATVLTEQRRYTHALCVSLDDILDGCIDIEDCSAGADAYEIVVDNPGDDVNLSNYSEHYTRISNRVTQVIGLVRRSSVLPVTVHIRLAKSPSELMTCLYIDLLLHVWTLVPDMTTVDLLRLDDGNISQLTKRQRSTQLIGHYEPFTDALPWDHPNWIEQYQRAIRLGCDLVRFIRPACSIEDNFHVSQFRSALEMLPLPRHVPVTAYNSGPLGRHSAYMNPTLTPVSPQDTCSGNSSLNQPPQLTAQSATKALYASFLADAMKLYVFGANVGYSMSPAMHNAGLEACGIPHRYEPYSTSSLDQVNHLVQDDHFGGASIGLPFKVEFIALTDSLSPHAQAIGAINTVIPIRQLNQDGSVPTGAAFFRQVNQAGPIKALYGENTDWIGIRACIRRGLSPANAVKPTTCALVIGAGGMARAAVYALLQVGVGNIAIYNRSMDNAHKLVGHFESLLQRDGFQALGVGRNTRFQVIQELSDAWPGQFRLPSIVISCIPTHPIGDTPSPEFKLPQAWLDNQTGGVIVELGYKTLNTPLLQQAVDNAHRGWVAMDGLDLLPSQGFAQFEFFTGKRAPRRVMTRAIFENYPQHHGRSNAEELRRRLKMMI